MLVEARFGGEAVHGIGPSESIEVVARKEPIKFSVGRRFSKLKDNSPKKGGERFLNMLGIDAGKLLRQRNLTSGEDTAVIPTPYAAGAGEAEPN